MRRLSTILFPAALAGLLAGLVPAAAAGAAPVVQPQLFGQHIASIAAGVPATLPTGSVGAIRLWDSGVTWRELQPTEGGPINFDLLNNAVNNARALGITEIMFTLGSPPQWAAQVKNSPLALYGPGSNSHPRSNKEFTDFLKAVATSQAGRSITSYQMWNEANLRDFYLGTPAQMAQLTKESKAALREVGSGAALVAASTTVRAKGPVGKFGKAYGPAMKKAKAWAAVDAVSAHFYPPATFGPTERVKYIKTIKKYYKKWGAGRKPLWDTEMNYGDTRSYMKTKRTYTGTTAATYVARTFIDSQRYKVSRVFWYGWDIHVLGTDMTSRPNSSTVTEGGQAFLETQRWMVGRTWHGCKVKAKVTTCTLRNGATKYTIRYAAKNKTLKLPAGTTAYKRLLDANQTPAKPGDRIPLTTQPILVIGG